MEMKRPPSRLAEVHRVEVVPVLEHGAPRPVALVGLLGPLLLLPLALGLRAPHGVVPRLLGGGVPHIAAGAGGGVAARLFFLDHGE